MRFTFIFFALGFYSLSFSQEQTQTAWKVSDFQLSIGVEQSFSRFSIQPSELLKFAPMSSLIPSYEANSVSLGSGRGWNAELFNMQLGLHPLNKTSGDYRMNRTLRLGISAQSVGTSLFSQFSETIRRTDTLLSSNNSSVFGFIDSVNHKNVFAKYFATLINLDAAFVWSTDADRRVILFAGVGSSGGIIFAANTQVSKHEWSSERISDADGHPIFSSGFEANQLEVKSERFNNQSGISACIYIPCGLDFRIGKKHPFWRQLHLFGEFRPVLRYIYVPEINSRIFPAVQGTIGLKVSWS